MVLAAAGIPFRVVPGITAGVGGLAYAGIPATARGANVAVAFITGYDSTDGTHWNQVATVSLAGLPSTSQAGLFTTSPQYLQISSQALGGTSGSSGASQATAGFDNVRLTGAAAGRGWTGQGIDTAGWWEPALGLDWMRERRPCQRRRGFRRAARAR